MHSAGYVSDAGSLLMHMNIFYCTVIIIYHCDYHYYYNCVSVYFHLCLLFNAIYGFVFNLF